MMLVRTTLSQSPIAGIGLFAAEFIPKGTVVWEFNPLVDLVLTQEEVETLSPTAREQFYNYAYFDDAYQKYVLCGDDARFFNHSDDPNCTHPIDEQGPDITIAARDIDIGEEITCDYYEFYGDKNRLHNLN